MSFSMSSIFPHDSLKLIIDCTKLFPMPLLLLLTLTSGHRFLLLKASHFIYLLLTNSYPMKEDDIRLQVLQKVH